MSSMRVAVGLGFLAAGILSAGAEVFEVSSREGLVSAVGRVRAGDRIELAPGNYGGGLFFEAIQGQPTAPVCIAAKDPEHRPVFEGQLHFSRCSGLELDGLHIRNSSSNGLNIDEGGPDHPPAEFIVVKNCRVENGQQGGNLDGIKLSGLKHYAILQCTIRNWSNGGSAIDQVGCHNGRIENCLITHTAAQAASGIQIKGGCAHIVVAGNQLKQAGERAINIGGSTGEPYFRPAGKHTTEASRIFVVGNDFEGSMAPVAFASSRDATVAYNQIRNPGKWIFRILQEKPVPPYEACGDHRVWNNHFIFQRAVVRTAINIGPHTRPETFQFKGNVWYAEDAPQRSTPQLPVVEENGQYGTRPGPVNEAEKKDFLLDCKKEAGLRI